MGVPPNNPFLVGNSTVIHPQSSYLGTPISGNLQIITQGDHNHETAGGTVHCFFLTRCNMWRFPEIVVPPNHPFYVRIFHEINHPASGVTP